MDKIKLSPYHKVFYNEWKINPERSDYNVVFDQSIHGNLDIKKLSNALELLAKDYILFNSHLYEKNNHLYWENNISIAPLQVFKKSSRELQQEFVTKSFNLETGPLYRFGLFCTGKNKYDLILILHHILIDGKSMSKFIKLVTEYYQDQSLKNNLEIQKSEIEANNKSLSEKVKFLRAQESNHFWRNNLADLMPRNDLPYFKNQSISNNKVNEYNFTVDKYLLLKDKSLVNKLTFNSIIGVWGALIARYSNSSLVHISYPVNIAINNEHLKYGSQINTAILPIRLELHTTYKSLKNYIDNFVCLGRVNPKTRYFDLPIVEIIGNSTVRELNVICAQINFKDTTCNFTDCKVKINHRYNLDIVGGEIALLYEDSADKLKFRILYKLALFSEEFIVQIAKHFENLLIQSLKNPDQKILENSLLTQEEYKTIVYKWNETTKKFPSTKTIHQLFEEQVAKTPNNVALTHGEQQLTYEELNKKSNLLARYIRKEYQKKTNKALMPDTIIALYLDRGLEMIVGILATLKTGGAYVPLDPDYPKERIIYTLKDTNAQIILTQKRTNLLIKRLEAKVLRIDLRNKEIYANQDKASLMNLGKQNNSNNLAYVIYTSGTTGNPKGVMVEHLGVINFSRNNNYINVNQETITLAYSNYVFDGSIFDIYTTLLNGGRLILVNKVVMLDEKKLKNVIVSNKVNTLFITTALFLNYARLGKKNPLLMLNNVLFGGEKVNTLELGLFIKNNQKTRLVHVYGPTENITFSTYCDLNIKNSDLAPIGKKLRDKTVYILDKNKTPVPIGVVGELYIGGVGVARGYLNQSELTKEHFVVNPFQSVKEKAQHKNEKLYKTGDLARYIPSGNIEYVGRNDFQIKINGYRIELGEIESKLCQHIWIKKAIVYFQHHVDNLNMVTNHQSLVAYYELNDKYSEGNLVSYPQSCSDKYNDVYNTSNDSFNVSEITNNPIKKMELSDNIIAESLEKYLLTQIPEYMVPKHYIKLTQIPLTSAGKTDYAILPPIKLINNRINSTPKNELEEKMITIWSDILGIQKEQIGIEDNFFKLGGNSFLIYYLKKKLSTLKEFAKIKVTDLFKYTTIQKLISSTTSSIISQAPVTQLTPETNSKVLDIAIIGMSGAFSGGKSIEEYWEQICSGKSGLKRHSIDECRSLGISEELLNNPDFVPITGKILGTTEFDAAFWGMFPDEVHNLDPQIRKFLEHCWYVLEDSGYLTDRSKFNIGVFAGGRNSPYSDHNMSRFAGQVLGRFGAAGELNTTQSSLAMQISHILNLTGISNNINTACSTSLVAIVEACKNLVNGSCDMAIAGGVSLILPGESGYIYQKGGIFAKDGQSRIFDSNSSGMVSGSGVGVVLLKPLKTAELDKDNIIAVIKGYAVNNDGNRKMSYTAPSVVGQEECILKAQKMAKVLFNQIDYIECHGTGTMLGDAIEVQALSEVFKNNHDSSIRQHTCYLGSAKANIGHAELAAGVAGLIKVCKMLKHDIIPKQINFEKCNPNINLADQKFTIPTENILWSRNNTQVRIAGISAFGIGGTNAHIIISDYLSDQNSNDMIDHENISNISFMPIKNPDIKPSYTLPISAKTTLSLTKYKEVFINYLKNTNDTLANIAYTLQSKRESYTNRISIIADSILEAIKKLESVDSITKTVIKNEKQDIIFMFPGQGAQYANMTLSLYQNSTKYRTILENCLLIVDELVGVEFRRILFPDLFPNENNLDKINQTQWAQIALFIVSYSLAKLLEDELDIKPSVYFGHSIGELVAATLSGVFQLNEAIKLVISRGKLMQAAPNSGMLQIQADYNILTDLIQDYQCDIAVLNSPTQFVAAGTKEDIAKLKAQLDKLSIPSILLKVSHAYHSYLMNDAANIFIDEFKGIKLYPPKHLFISNVTGSFIKDTEAMDPNYWSKHIKEKVLFMDGIKTIHKNFTNPFFIQIGPGKELLSFVKQSSAKNINGIAIINELLNITDDIMLKEVILSEFWECGCVINFNANYANNNVVHLPHYCFDSQVYDFQPNAGMFVDNMYNSIQNELNIVENQVLETGLSKMYYEIATIFIQLLKLNNLSIHDSFFDLGGNSLTALSLIADLKNIGINLTLLDITNINTVSKIYTFANHMNNKFSNKIIIPLLLNNQERKIFFIHPIGGTVMQYLEIVKKLDSKYDYYGIQNINLLDSNALKAETFEDLCAIYLDEILQIQDGGEYIIMGSSIGGNIAYEISRQLIDSGRGVKYIVMFDSWAQYLNDSYSSEDSMMVILSTQKEKDNIVKTSVSNATYNNLMNARMKLFHMFLKYQPKKSMVKIYLCKASEISNEHVMVENACDNFWQEFTSIPVTIYNISGNHETIHSEPGLSKITACVNNLLK